ncbi:ABC transporter ATP-binding protein [Cellulomonas endophytica]|uniref:ABC transporter ATP-binding protein n=1 Tax=Cellulomonas endophytica TaxID=2494735 RepID=UPI0010121DF8|nr:ABC transporter ATP-binding protein [Cellulomonas endophytica]
MVLGTLTSLGASILALLVPQVLRALVNGPLLGSGSRTAVIGAAALVLLLGVLEAFLVWCRRALVALPGTGAENDMRRSLFRHLLDLPLAFHDRWPGGQLLSRSMSDLNVVRRWLIFAFVMLVVSVTTVVVGLGLMLWTAWPLALVYLVGAVPVLLLGFRFREDYKVVARRARDQAGDLAGRVEESVHGIRVLKAFGRGEDALDEFVRQADMLRGTEIQKARTLSKVSLALGAIPELALAVSLVLGVWLTSEGRLSVGALVAFFATAAVVNAPVERIGSLLAMTLDAKAATDRFVEVMDTVPAVRDPEHPAPVPPPGPDGSRVELRGVVVAHATGRPVLDGVDLVLEPGTTTALVGLTGSGKTTLAQLVPRLSDPTAGQVLLDGVDLRDLRRCDVRAAVAVAFEDPVLFSASVRENVLLGLPDEGEVPDPAEGGAGGSRPDDAERDRVLAEALEGASAEFVAALPQREETLVGEEGLSLSGGQRQRLALARAVAAHPRVLVLDDPLSALDVTTEAAVTARLRDVLRGTTTLVVAHRSSTVALADRVAVLEDGRVTGVGTHRELLETHPHYRFVLTAMHDAPRDLDAEPQDARADEGSRR